MRTIKRMVAEALMPRETDYATSTGMVNTHKGKRRKLPGITTVRMTGDNHTTYPTDNRGRHSRHMSSR